MSEPPPEWLKRHFLKTPGSQLPWAEVMRLALYEPEHGYYRQGVRRIGRSGDFYTSVSVGSLYGELIAHLAWKVWKSLNQPNEFVLVEQGAHDGQLAHDVWSALDRMPMGDFAASVQMMLIEPDPSLAEAQRCRLSPWANKIRWVTKWSEVKGLGMMYANELLDAFPVHRLQRRNGQWHELWVSLNEKDHSLRVVDGEFSSPDLAPELESLNALPYEFAEGQHIDLNLELKSWIQQINESAFQGLLCLADYGLPRQELYLPARMDGTLRRYFGHHCDGQFLTNLGDSDLTAHVDFTRLAELALQGGWQLVEFVEQGRFLTRLAAERMQQPEFSPNPAWIRQFQTLTHPNHLGQAFHVIALAKHSHAAQVCICQDLNSDPDAALRRLGEISVTP